MKIKPSKEIIESAISIFNNELHNNITERLTKVKLKKEKENPKETGTTKIEQSSK